MVEEEAQVGKELAITACGIYLAPVTYFKYLGRFLPAADENWPIGQQPLESTTEVEADD